MVNTEKAIKGTGVICKGNVKGNYEQVPMDLFNYLELELITHTDLVIYVKLLNLYNHDYGYAFPTIPQLMVSTRIGSKATVHNSLNQLEEVGLIQKSKTNRGNNVYVVFMPLGKSDLYKLVPHKVKQLKESETKILKIGEQDKERYQHYQQNKLEQEAQPHIDQNVQARQVIPKVEATEHNDLTPEEVKMLKRLELL